MRWPPWRRDRPAVREAEQNLRQAERDLRQTRRLAPRVEQLTGDVHERWQANHFSEVLEQIIFGRGNGHGHV